jgi:hypothetical protein
MSKTPGPWRLGYCTYTNDADLVRMGCWNGDTTGGFVVSASEIEWKEYRSHDQHPG